jgi:hypothetical protein
MRDVADHRGTHHDDRRIVEKGRSRATQRNQQPQPQRTDAAAQGEASADRGIQQAG